MGSVRSVDRGFFPLDEELELLPGSLTPYGHEIVVRLSGWMPFEQAAKILEDLLGIQVSQALSQRYAEEAGAAYVQIQTEEVERIEKDRPETAVGAEKMVLSADGAMVPLLHGEWAEVRTLVIGEAQPAVKEQGEWVVHTRNLSYFSRKVNAQEFGRLAIGEIQRRGIEHAKELAAVMDGAEWEQGFTDYHCPHATRILDVGHAGEHISPIGAYLHGENTAQTQEWIREKLHQLKRAGPSELLSELRQLYEQHPDAQVVSGNLAYLEKREKQMQYPLFQAQGWPIGSGMVESGNKLVVEARLKGSGMHWKDEHVNSMVSLRNMICSDRWKEDWPKIAAQLRRNAIQRRRGLHQARIEKNLLAMPSPQVVTVEDPPEPAPSLPMVPERSKPPKENPWRRFKYGRSLYQSSRSAKN
jgi:hypothetical protein